MRKCHMIQSKYWTKARDKELTSDEILVEIFLITCPNCGPSGGFMMAENTVSYHIAIDQDRVSSAMEGLVKKSRIKIYPGDWVFVIGKWEYEGNDSPKLLEALKTDITCCPTALKTDFNILYPETYAKLGIGYSENRIPERKGKDEDKEKDKNEKRNKEGDKSPPPEKYIDAVKAIFPKAPDDRLIPQAETLEEIERLDRFVDTGQPITLDELLPALIWAAGDEFWSANFKSCAGLRKRRDGAGSPTKWEKIYARYQQIEPQTQGGDIDF